MAANGSGFKRKSSGAPSKANHHKHKKSKPDTSNLSSSAQKRALKQERQSHRRHADVVRDGKEIWNKLRVKTNTKDDTKALVEKLMNLLKDDAVVREIALQHDASRVVQAAIQFSSVEQRRNLCQSLAPQMAEMSKVQYAHFCVLKLIQYGYKDDETVQILLKSLKGQLCKLAVHSVGARVIELLFSTFSSKQTKSFRQEFYGPHFSIFAQDGEEMGNTLCENIAKKPQHKEAACEYVQKHVISKGIDKGLYGFAYFQQLLWDYTQAIGITEFRSSLLSTLVDHALHLVSTRDGTSVVVKCAAYGTAKDRKRLLKCFKGYARSSLLHRDAYLSMLQIALVTDDTVSVHKSILAELVTNPEDNKDDQESNQHPLLELALDDNASKLLLFLLLSESMEEQRRKYMDPLECDLLELTPPEIDGVPTSKKNNETRRQELLRYLTPHLKQMCQDHAEQLSKSISGSKVLLQVYRQIADDDDVLLETLANLSLSEHPVGHFLMQHLINSCEKFRKAVTIPKPTSSRNAFILATLMDHADAKSRLPKMSVNQLKKTIDEKQKAKEATAGIEALMKKLQK
mmetsp:Transcript_12654/g.18594  ORF Transcript_12654/g.18594 Transcript_12654/m.18594 type:complete len:572 (+) Transcript_12654:89-1804(+)|eukprot:CAMPEP_0194214286 /NCGR_PEP_ID=MMETSP0156-20130528/15470_1 /TAXON_ID=33649 /ORGANISM="Thalassionema nitzschioides, Strain L26-B" /LENGTH=571 /DNA_ID=CAMNT_0038942515 /DNA_START=12 /DNA_END=1727 /DNA_ORIENTATION=+